MIVSKEEEVPQGTQMMYPDGSVYVYVKAVEDFDPGTYGELNVNGNLVKFKGGLRFPPIVVVNTVPRNYWTFVMIRGPQAAAKQNPSGGIIT